MHQLDLHTRVICFREYLMYDRTNIQQMCSFIARYPQTLDMPEVAAEIVKDPKCYYTAKTMGYMDRLMAVHPAPHLLLDQWLEQKHAPALANERSEPLSWSQWAHLAQDYEHGQAGHAPWYPDEYYYPQQLLKLANKINEPGAAMYCALYGIAVPKEHMLQYWQQWGPQGRAAFAWVCQHTGIARAMVECDWSELQKDLADHANKKYVTMLEAAYMITSDIEESVQYVAECLMAQDCTLNKLPLPSLQEHHEGSNCP